MLALACASGVLAQDIEWQVSSLGPPVSFRGLSVVDQRTLWACGSQGKVCRSVDGGRRWQECSPPGFEQVEFRCIHAFSSNVACMASAGTPAVILRTTDGGQIWIQAYKHDSPMAFFDALVFWNAQEGLAVSDPVAGRWLLVRTSDGGRSWQELEGARAPEALASEAAFAASNGSLAIVDAGQWWLGTGGETGDTRAALLNWNADSGRWRRVRVPLPAGPSSGVFAVDFSRHPVGVVVGGNYRQEESVEGTAAWSSDGGLTWHAATPPPSGYRSSVTHWTPSNGTSKFVAVGPTGTDVSADGKAWSRASAVGFHTVRSAPDGTLWGVGADGRVGQFGGTN